MPASGARRLLTATAAVTLALGLGGVALAASSGGSTVIKGCYDKTSGALRVLTPHANSCGSGTQEISWNQVGPPGKPGAKGKQGAKGNSGPGYNFTQYIGSNNQLGHEEVDGPSVRNGNYMVVITAVVDTDAGDEDECQLEDYYGLFQSNPLWPVSGDTFQANGVVQLTTLITVSGAPKPDQLFLYCVDEGDEGAPELEVQASTWDVSPVNITVAPQIIHGTDYSRHGA
jgi:hypothetical protein